MPSESTTEAPVRWCRVPHWRKAAMDAWPASDLHRCDARM
jgi:hypothetical protein